MFFCCSLFFRCVWRPLQSSLASVSMATVRLTHLSLLHACAAIQAEVDVSVVVEELLQHVQHAGHLSEDQHPVAASFQLPQQRVESLQLTCAWKQMEMTCFERPLQTCF